jgi:hypothetical protein
MPLSLKFRGMRTRTEWTELVAGTVSVEGGCSDDAREAGF